MSYAESNVSTHGYNDIRIVVTLSGTSATASVQFRRNGSCGSYKWTDHYSTLTINGVTKDAPYTDPGYVCSNWVVLATVSGFTLSSSGGTYSWSFNNGNAGGKLYGSGTFTIGASATAPSGLSVSVSSRTYNTVTLAGKVDSYGTGGSGNHMTLAVCNTAASTGSYGARRAVDDVNPAAGSTGTATVTNSSTAYDGGLTLSGCGAYKPLIWVTNEAVANNLVGDTFYLPPAPLASVTVSTAVAGTSATATIKITGAAEDGTGSHNISGAKVTTQYRVYNGSSWGSWTTVASNHSPATTQTVTVTGLPGSTSCQVQARQLTYSDTNQISEVKTTSFTTPSTYHLTYNGSEATSCTYNGSEVTTITLNGTTVWVK